MRERRDFYEVLGVPRDVDDATLKRAYRNLALRYHPDQNPENPEAEARFKEVSEAYTVLSDPEQRARYDRRGWEGVGDIPYGVGTFTELFENLFGDLFGKKKKQKGRDLRYTLDVSFVEAALGATKKIQFASRSDCEACGGSGGKGGEKGLSVCATCGGKGEVKVQQGFFSLGKSCTACGGSGQVVRDPCDACKGAGYVEKEREYEVTIPPGMEDGGTRRVAGQGERGRRGGPAGDLNVIVRVRPHPLFRREGQVIAIEVPISVTTAALGGVLDVPTLEGKVEMRVPPGTQSGTVFRLRGQGMGERGRRGDAHVRVVVETPTNLSPEQRELYERLEASLAVEQQPLRQKFDQKVKDEN
jgi:molecular chaperone DnaJ